MRRGLDQIRRADNGLVYVPPSEPIVGYGWTDIVRKTGHLLFTSLLYYQACVELDAIQEAIGGEPLFDGICGILHSKAVENLPRMRNIEELLIA